MKIRDTRNGDWYWVNNAVMACKHITHADKCVYSALASFGGCQEIRPSFEIIAERSDTSIRQAKNSVKKLIEVDLIDNIKGGGRGIANVYDLLKCLKGCKICTLSKGCKIKPERVQNFPIKGAKSAPQLYKELDKEKDNFNVRKKRFTNKDEELVKLLHNTIVERYPHLAGKFNFESDCEEMNKLNRLDGWSYEQIEYIAKWSQQDDFWKQNILSVQKLRKQFDKLVIKVKSNKNMGVVKV